MKLELHHDISDRPPYTVVESRYWAIRMKGTSMYRLTLFGLLIFVGVAGCNSSSEPSDPVSGYKEFLDGEFDRIKQKVPDFALDSNYKLDVSKTDSLTSPLVGTCVVDVVYPFVGKNKEGVILFTIALDMKHGWQEDKWVLTTGKATIKSGKVIKDSEYGAYSQVAEDNEGKYFDFETLDELGKLF